MVLFRNSAIFRLRGFVADVEPVLRNVLQWYFKLRSKAQINETQQLSSLKATKPRRQTIALL